MSSLCPKSPAAPVCLAQEGTSTGARLSLVETGVLCIAMLVGLGWGQEGSPSPWPSAVCLESPVHLRLRGRGFLGRPAAPPGTARLHFAHVGVCVRVSRPPWYSDPSGHHGTEGPGLFSVLHSATGKFFLCPFPPTMLRVATWGRHLPPHLHPPKASIFS